MRGGGGDEAGGARRQRGGGEDGGGLAEEHLEDVVDDVTGAGAPLRQVVLGEEAQRLAVHLELLHVDLLEVELLFAVLEELAHVLAAPGPRVRRQATYKQILIRFHHGKSPILQKNSPFGF